MSSNKIIFEYSIFIFQIFTIFPFFMIHFTYQILETENASLIIIFLGRLIVILKLSRIFESIKYHLSMHLKDLFLNIFLKKLARLLCFKLHFTECAVIKYTLFFLLETPIIYYDFYH